MRIVPANSFSLFWLLLQLSRSYVLCRTFCPLAVLGVDGLGVVGVPDLGVPDLQSMSAGYYSMIASSVDSLRRIFRCGIPYPALVSRE